VSRKESARGPCSLISITDASASRVRQFRTTARGYSSHAAEELESTPFIGDDDVAYLQRIVTLGSSASKVSDLATLEELFAMPDIPIAMKTIGAKVIIAALEQRQEWALLPALLPIAQFRRLAEDQNLGVGEQLFAALLRGQFVFARRRSGAAPDVYRTLDLAAKCNALHTTAVIHAVQAGYQSLGLESPTDINELLDIGPADAASLQRLTRQQNDEYGDEEDEASAPIGTARFRLTGGMFMRQITRARKTQPVYTVLPAVLAALPRLRDRDPNGRQRILGAICGRDVYTVSEVLGLARALGAVPNAQVWTQTTTNAIYKSGPTDAAEIVRYVYNNIPDGYVGYNAVHEVIMTLVGRDYMAVPSHDVIRLAWTLFELHRKKGGDRALDTFRGSLMPLIWAFMADFNIKGRETAVEVLCRYTELKRLSSDQLTNVTWAGTGAELASLRSISHLDALETALAEPAGQFTEQDLIMVFSTIMRFRYADASTAPIEALLRVATFAREKGFADLNGYARVYIRSIATSLVHLHVERGAGLLPVASSEESVRPVPEQHMSQALVSIRHVEQLCHESGSGFTMDKDIASALFFAYTVHNGAPDDCARLRPVVLSATATAGPFAARAAGVRLFKEARTYEDVKEVWATLSSQGLAQSVDLQCRYASRLLSLRRVHAAIEFARRHIPDDPKEHEVVRFTAGLLLSTKGTPFELAARETLPITADDARTRNEINKVTAYRRNMDLRQVNIMSDL